MLGPLGGNQQHIVAPKPFIWNKSYSLASDELDNKHRMIFRAVNTLLQSEDLASALEQLLETTKLFQELFRYEERAMEILLQKQQELKDATELFQEDQMSVSTLASDQAASRQHQTTKYVHPRTGEVIELDNSLLTPDGVDQHIDKHQLFLEDLESIRRRLEFTSPMTMNRRAEVDADARGKRELEYIANWYIHHIHNEDASIRASYRLFSRINFGETYDADNGMMQKEAKVAAVVRFRTQIESMEWQPLSMSEFDIARQLPYLIFSRDWLAYIQTQFVVGISLLRLPKLTSEVRLVVANSVFTEYTQLQPWLAAGTSYDLISDADINTLLAGNRLNYTTGCRVRKHRIASNTNKRHRVIGVALPVRVRSPLLNTRCEYLVDFTYFHAGDRGGAQPSAILSSAATRQRSKLVSSSYLGALDKQNLSESSSLTWQHAPTSNAFFNGLLSWLTLELLMDPRWLDQELPNFDLEIAPAILTTREREMTALVREAIETANRPSPDAALTHMISMEREGGPLKVPIRSTVSKLTHSSDQFDLDTEGRIERTETVSTDNSRKSEEADLAVGESPLNELIRTTAGVETEFDEKTPRNMTVVQELVEELGDLKQFIEPGAAATVGGPLLPADAGNKPAKKSNKKSTNKKPKRKRLMD